ncbi:MULTISPECIES: hypothetical protein [Planktothricoides]|uniref:Uncharacterized protein n=1 Tax=Planktothricoides raciborskii FACHB-1370 TaxID=2949576 RepID=A0ABR8EDS2_9CYAN|nr:MULTISPECIES: hypothetical protein [Planktothricoides]MBD2543722.1 hypothetical protein [Planktothricoides raciborskii FACHB-1370]MBD2582384.1 hypothetical protein [Planktothricoides raciborskii FACHB-1261]
MRPVPSTISRKDAIADSSVNQPIWTATLTRNADDSKWPIFSNFLQLSRTI